MLDCIYHFKYKDQDIYINSRSGVHHDYVLNCYLEWYNNDFRFDIDGTIYAERLRSDFVYIDKFSPIDFYDETKKFKFDN